MCGLKRENTIGTDRLRNGREAKRDQEQDNLAIAVSCRNEFENAVSLT